MQPYVFPYLGYFQLINSVDRFVVYDDVTFIKQGWINRNNILVNNRSYLFSVPLERQSSFTKIKDIRISSKHYDRWKDKFYKTVEQNYKRAPFFEDAFKLLHVVLEGSEHDFLISKLAISSLKSINKYLDLKVEFVNSSSDYNNSNLSGQERVMDICMKEAATQYVNPISGAGLYSKEDFRMKNLDLYFIKPQSIVYDQMNNEFIPWLSIIDVIMFNSVEQVALLIKKYEIL